MLSSCSDLGFAKSEQEAGSGTGVIRPAYLSVWTAVHRLEYDCPLQSIEIHIFLAKRCITAQEETSSILLVNFDTYKSRIVVDSIERAHIVECPW